MLCTPTQYTVKRDESLEGISVPTDREFSLVLFDGTDFQILDELVGYFAYWSLLCY